jgi:hypothetical protein
LESKCVLAAAKCCARAHAGIPSIRSSWTTTGSVPTSALPKVPLGLQPREASRVVTTATGVRFGQVVIRLKCSFFGVRVQAPTSGVLFWRALFTLTGLHRPMFAVCDPTGVKVPQII